MAVIGISASAASNIKSAIKEYKSKVAKANPACDAAISTTVIRKAIRGANTINQIKRDIDIATDNAEKQLINYLTTMETQLDQVVATYKANDSAASAVTGVIKKS